MIKLDVNFIDVPKSSYLHADRNRDPLLHFTVRIFVDNVQFASAHIYLDSNLVSHSLIDWYNES